MADQPPEKHRPSFSSFWRRSKEALTSRKLTFVESTSVAEAPEPQENTMEEAPDEDDQTTEEPSAAAQPTKAQARRAQVRKAQIQHRQRKANYVKELEMDITRLRDLISETQRGSSILRRENEYIRSQASVHYIITPVLVPAEAPPAPPDLSRILGEVTMGLEFDEVLDAPSYRITSSPDMMSVDSQDDLLAAEQAADPGMLPLLGLSPEQTQQVINFILAMEHICWDHFDHSNFEPGTEPTGLEYGHTLMASSLALRTAPGTVFDQVIATKQNMRSPDPTTRAAPIPPAVPWQVSGLTLQNLYGLAKSVNPSDLDVTPVQAFFEWAEQYPLAVLLRPDIMAQLKHELTGVIKCPHFGAVIERGACESVVERVLGPATEEWQSTQRQFL